MKDEFQKNILKFHERLKEFKDDSSLVQLFIMLHRPVNFEISAVACTSQQANLKKQWSMKYYKQLNGKAIIFNVSYAKGFVPRNNRTNLHNYFNLHICASVFASGTLKRYITLIAPKAKCH